MTGWFASERAAIVLGTSSCGRWLGARTGDSLDFIQHRLACIRIEAATKKITHRKDELFSLAGPTGFEPAISSVTGRRDRPTSLRALVERIERKN